MHAIETEVLGKSFAEVLHLVGLDGRDAEPVRRFSLGMKERLGTALSSLASGGSAVQPYLKALILGAVYTAACWIAAWQVFQRREVTE